MGLLNRQAILAANDIKEKDVPVPEWGGTVRVRGATAAERAEYEQDLYLTEVVDGETKTKDNFAAAQIGLVVKCVVDEDGEPVFKKEDVLLLIGKGAAPVGQVFRVIQELSGMTRKARAALEKNSGTGEAAGTSPSHSQENSKEGP